MLRRALMVGLALTAATFGATVARAGDNVRADGRFVVWAPDNWVLETGKPIFRAHNPQNTIQAIAARLPGAASAAMERAKAFINEELDDVEFEGNTLSGSAEDEGDDVSFVARTIVDGADLLIVLTYGDKQLLGQPGPKGAVERIRASLKIQ
jgi:hypothetical protein